jgi:hypothetical protein
MQVKKFYELPKLGWISKHNSLSLLAPCGHLWLFGEGFIKRLSWDFNEWNVKKGWTHYLDTQQEEAINMNPKT